MKIRWNHRYVQLGVTAFLVIAASILFYYGIFHMKSLVTGIKTFFSIMAPIIYGAAIAYLLTPIDRMTDFFLENLCRVRHTTVVASRIEDPGEFPQPKMTPITGTCASVRLDSLIALAFGTSRSSIVHCIEEGLVFVNGKLITSNGYEPKEGDIISVRKKGRFIFDGVSRRTKKGRLGVRILLYI